MPNPRQRSVQNRSPAHDTLSDISSSDDENEFPSFSYRPQIQLTEDGGEDEGNTTNAEQHAESLEEPQLEISDGEAQIAVVDDPTVELPGQPAEILEETNEDLPEQEMVEETVGQNGGDRPQRNSQAPQRFTYYV